MPATTPRAVGHEEEAARVRLGPRTLQLVLDALPDAAVVVDETGLILTANRDLAILLGYQLEDLVGKPVEHMLPYSRRAAHERARAGFTDDPRRRPMSTGQILEARRADGRELAVTVALTPLLVGRRRLVLAALRDATELLQARRDLEKSEQRFRAMFDGASDGIALWDCDDRLIELNPALQAMLRLPRDLAIGRHRAELLTHQGTRTAGEASGWQAGAVPVEVADSTIDDADRPLTLSIIRDIGHRTRLERERARQLRLERAERLRLAELDALKDQFLNRISHDLRTPLTAIYGYAELLVESSLPPDEREMATSIAAGARRMRDLVDDLLSITEKPHLEAAVACNSRDARAAILHAGAAEVEELDSPSLIKALQSLVSRRATPGDPGHDA